MPTLRWLDKECNSCGKQLNTWDMRLSKTLTYEFPVCEHCIAVEYDMDVAVLRSHFENVFGLVPCTGL